MDFYRIKHKPTGLYYTPGQGRNNLTKKGKIYTSGGNALTYFNDGLPVRAGSKLLEELRKHYRFAEQKYGRTEVFIPKSDFVLEPVTVSI